MRPPLALSFPFLFSVLLSLPPLASAYETLSDASLRSLPSPGTDFDIHTGALLAPILTPRVSGTPGNAKILAHLSGFFSEHLPDWRLEVQNSTSRVPAAGNRDVPFTNLIASRAPPDAPPPAVPYLTLAAHFDSKYRPEGFIGATDSAAPCAMLLHIARALDPALARKWAADKANSAAAAPKRALGLQIIFFDGEEAFGDWTATDSIWGAKALAAAWEASTSPARSAYANRLDAMELLVLLDLLGAKGPRVPSYYKTTHWAYAHMADAETRLRKLGLFKSAATEERKRREREEARAKKKNRHGKGDAAKKRAAAAKRYDASHFLSEPDKKDTDQWMGGYIGDDHEPFYDRGVEVLHLIPSPFPRVWHQMDDDGRHLDLDTVEDWARLVGAFTAEYMELDEFMGDGKGSGKEKRAVKEEL